MNFVFVNYDYCPNIDSPREWVNKIKAYTGSLEWLGRENIVVRVEQINYSGDCSHNGVRYFFADYGKKTTTFPWKLNRFIEDLNADIVVVQGLQYPLQVMQLRLQLNKKTKIIAQHHAEKPSSGMKKYLQRIADRYIDAYLFASQSTGIDWVNKGNLLSPEKIHEVMEVSSVFRPIEKTLAKETTGVSGNPVFLWVGRLHEDKDPLSVVSAFLQFINSEPSARLYMIYQTDELLSQIEALLDKAKIKNTVILIGQVEHDELLYWYNSADFIVSGMGNEGSGTVVCEAMSCGCIPIVTDLFSFRTITDNGNCGITYESGNEAALLSAMMQTRKLNIPEKQKRSLEYFQMHLSFEAIARQIQGVAGSL
jgi:glycosyltransferase involved in cell wall biosynthesis